MATPPRMRQTTKTVKLGARPVPIDRDRRRGTPARMRSRLRPKRSLRPPGDQRPDEAADQGADYWPSRPADGGRQVEELLEERLGPADDDPVVAEEQPAHGRDEGRRPDKAHVVGGSFGQVGSRRIFTSNQGKRVGNSLKNC